MAGRGQFAAEVVAHDFEEEQGGSTFNRGDPVAGGLVGSFEEPVLALFSFAGLADVDVHFEHVPCIGRVRGGGGGKGKAGAGAFSEARGESVGSEGPELGGMEVAASAHGAGFFPVAPGGFGGDGG